MPPRRAIALLRGINVGAHNRLPMPALRDALNGAGFEEVQTYVQSGNVVLRSDLAEPALSSALARLIVDRFGLEVPVVVRDSGELAEIVAANPFPQAADSDPKRLQVTFLSSRLADDAAARVRGIAGDASAGDAEAIALSSSGRHIYGWHPGGIHASKLARELTDRRLGVTATARNWTTVTTLLEMTR